MATVSKIGSVTAGIYTNPNTLSRSMSAAYTALGTQINTLADIFSYNQGAPVQDVLDMRWTWNFLAPTARSGTITTINSGLSGTSVFTYAGDDYQSVNPLFRVVRPGFPAESRPATIYETFLQYKTYIDTTIAAEASRLATFVSSFNYSLTGVDDGSLLVANQSAIAGSLWRTSYEAGVYTLNAPLGYAKFRGAATYLELAGPKIRIQNYLSLKGIDQENVDQVVPTADAGRGNLYFSSVDKKVHIIDEDGLDITFGEVATGDITFDGVKIIGAGTASGDGLGKGTIELVPDNDFYDITPNSGYGDGGQYLIIDPTAPGHIHVRAGGPIDEAAAVLILGGEKANVTVRDQDNSYNEKHYVTINTQSNTGDEYAWVFGNDGNLTVPEGCDINSTTGDSILWKHEETAAGSLTATIPITTVSTSYFVNSTDGAHLLTLPPLSGLKLGWEITIADIQNYAGTNTITITTDIADTFVGYGSNPLIIDTNSGLVRLQVTSQGWLILYSK